MNSTAKFDDLIQPFQVEGLGFAGRLVRLGPALDAVLGGHGYPGAVAGLLGESLTLTAALSGALKYDGIFTLQIQSDGPVGLIVTDITSDGGLRGYSRFDAERVNAAAEARGGLVPALLGSGHLAFTVDQGPDMERYQGITALEGATLAECAHAYFRSSEQLQTAIVLASRAGDADARAAALMIQRLPEENPAAGDEAEDDWRRAVILASSVTREEMLDPGLAPNDLLFRLFHEDGVRVYQPRGLRHACRCSGKRVAATLASFPRSEMADMAEDGRITVTCEFCKAEYCFAAETLEPLPAP